MTMRLSGVALLVTGTVLAIAPSRSLAQKKQRDLITREEILKSSQADQDLYMAIKALRPRFLEMPRGTRSLGGTGTAGLAVYMDKLRQTGVDALRQIMANTVEEVRYLDPARSQNEYGVTANGGAIVIKLYKGKPTDPLRTP